ncbi:MAG: hypothetical protein ACLFVE_16060 [Chitinispirillaceae bacterium]
MEATLEKPGKNLPQINDIEEKDLERIIMPLEYYLGECNRLSKRISEHRDYLEENHMDFTMLDKMDEIVEACIMSLAQFHMVDFPNTGAKVEFEKAKEDAEYLLFDLITTFDFAFQDAPHLLKKVSFIRQGGSHMDMVTDLADCNVLGTENSSYLEKIHYDMDNVARARELSLRLADLLAQATADKSESKELRIHRDKCFTLLKLTMDAALRHARYIYRHDKKTAEEFRINPPPRRSYRRKNDDEDSTAQA